MYNIWISKTLSLAIVRHKWVNNGYFKSMMIDFTVVVTSV